MNALQETIWLLEFNALDATNNSVTLRFASGGYIDPVGNYYDLRLKQPSLYSINAYSGAVLASQSNTAFGESLLINSDGGLDYLADYAVDGRDGKVSVVINGVVSELFKVTVESLAYEGNLISVRLRDPQSLLDLNHPVSVYAGNNVLPNGLEGVADDIAGQVKPKVYGRILNGTPVLVNTSQLIYEYHDYSISPAVAVTLNAVYDRGVLLTAGTNHTTLANFYAATPAPGSYDTYLGYFKLGADPAGTVTFDATSAKVLIGDVFQLLANERGTSVVAADVTTLNALNYQFGYYMQETVPTSQIADLLAASYGGFWVYNLLGTISAKRLLAPGGTVAVDIPEYKILDISRDSTGAGENGLPIFETRLLADKVETVQTDLAGAVNRARRAKLAKEYRVAVSTNAATKTRHPNSQSLEITTGLRSLANAQTEANRIQSLLGVRRDRLNVTFVPDVGTDLPAFEVGSIVRITTPKLGYGAGKNFILLGYTLNAKLFKTTLNLFG